jgi:Cellulose binding domain/Glycosyl hydrolases family 18
MCRPHGRHSSSNGNGHSNGNGGDSGNGRRRGRPRPDGARRSGPPGFLPAIAMAAVLAAGGGTAAALAASGGAAGASLAVGYQTVSSWGTGYTGQYTITNDGAAATAGWTLGFRLPGGASVTSLWNGADKLSGGQVTVTSASWDGAIKPGGSADVGFVVEGSAAAPQDCTIDGAPCRPGGISTGSPAPSPSSTAPTPTPTPTATPGSSPSPAPTAPSPSPSQPAGTTASFAPYVDTSLFPPFSLTTVAADTGVKQFNLAFVVSGGGCTPEWGGTTAIGGNPVAAEISALRAMGGDVRVSFGGEDGSELAQTCTSVSQLAAAYQQVISAYGLDKIDFDIEGAALDDTAANALRDQALAQLQAQDPGLQVSFTLPVEPSGLTQDGIDLLDGAVSAGVKIAAVNVMAMDYGDANAPDPATMMGSYAIDAATATDAQVAGVLGISDAAAWSMVAVTPMIGQNDQADEVFTIADAQQLEAFAAAKHLAWLSMWSAGRDQECPGGVDTSAEPTCSGIVQTPLQFMETLGRY